MRKVLLVLSFAIWVGGCAIGNTQRHDLGDASLDLETEHTVAVSVVDHRPYIVDGDKDPSFVGLMRAAFGNPWDVTTGSERPLAQDMTTSIVDSMKQKDIDAVAVVVPHSSDNAAARQELLITDADRYVLLVLQEWKSDTYINTAFIYNATLEVLGPTGVPLAEKTLSGRDNLGAAAVPADARIDVENAVRQKIEEMLNDPEIVAALD
ncbi:MAG: hypothetical protein AAF563_03160 [Pseudomonadota bacterium]